MGGFNSKNQHLHHRPTSQQKISPSQETTYMGGFNFFPNSHQAFLKKKNHPNLTIIIFGNWLVQPATSQGLLVDGEILSRSSKELTLPYARGSWPRSAVGSPRRCFVVFSLMLLAFWFIEQNWNLFVYRFKMIQTYIHISYIYTYIHIFYMDP